MHTTGGQITSLGHILSVISSAGLVDECCVAGGAVRDSVHNKPPKDYDIVCLSTDAGFRVAGALSEITHQTLQVYGDYDAQARELEPHNDFWDRWELCIKVGDVDVLCSRECSFEGAVHTFDNTLNMWMAQPGELRYVGTAFAPLGRALGTKPVSPERAQYIQAKAEAFGWEYIPYGSTP